MYVDVHGISEIINSTTGDKMVLNYAQKGWTQASYGAVTGEVKNAQGKTILKINGNWREKIDITNQET